jgi:hypothetical protein
LQLGREGIDDRVFELVDVGVATRIEASRLGELGERCALSGKQVSLAAEPVNQADDQLIAFLRRQNRSATKQAPQILKGGLIGCVPHGVDGRDRCQSTARNSTKERSWRGP